ncbi:S-layer homology domain-containing protein [Paenibacillus aceris]|uniref:SLH domain-containing protein n=1 Tax=Paenibacillus aceris TaxID=869555 RepID=A0ABS4I327_9BACL|nr:S-layer homology domain-containing protein [Paenibacillus aceris]MBP1965326.1 hypothetical protein [Paenibacillus aceris]NHW36006.1 S-layer homology domain-containing protein [Paenibacillus aceris]
MRKKFKLIACILLACTLQTSVANADDAITPSSSIEGKVATAIKSSSDFKDLVNVEADLKVKIDALLKAGIFEGTEADVFGINENMTRAQFAKVLVLIFGTKVDDTLKLSSFPDVKADDKANGWAVPYIEAAKKAGFIDGKSETTFDPGANVTLGEFATALVKGLGKKIDVTLTPWYKDAIGQAIAAKLLSEGAEGSKYATRADLVLGAYEGQKAYLSANQPAKVSLTAVKASGAQKIDVTLNRDVDTSKATFTVEKGTLTISATAVWAADNKSATLTLNDTKLSSGDYTVTLGGLDASAIDQATASFTAQDETMQKLDFVSTSDVLADAKNIVVKIKATNQYGENASFSAGSYSVVAGNNNDVNPRLSKSADGTLQLKLDTSSLTGKQENISRLPVTVWFNDTHISLTKTFTLGNVPFVTKMEIGDVTYSSGTAINKKGETATISLNLYDHYGGMLGRDSDAYKDANLQAIFNPYEENLMTEIGNWDSGNSNAPQLRVSLKNDIEQSVDYNLLVQYQGATAQKKISVKSAALATKVQLGDLSGVIAAGDTDIYIPVIAFDANGNQLSVEDLISDTNINRIKVIVSGATFESNILNYGDHKGTIHLKNITVNARGVVSVSVNIATAGANSFETKQYMVGSVRVPDHLKVATEPTKYINPGTYSSFAIQAIDQYGSNMDSSFVTDANGNLLLGVTDTSRVTGNVYYYVTWTPNNLVSGKKWISTDADGGGLIGTAENYDAVNNIATYKNIIADSNGYGLKNDQFDLMHNTYRLYTDLGATGSFGFTAKLMKVGTDGRETVIHTVTRTVNVTSGSDNLTYSINAVPTLFNALNSGVIETTNYDGINTLTDETQKDAKDSKFGREVTISAVTAAGDSVALVAKQISAISSSNMSVARVVYSNGQAFVIGNAAGTAALNISYRVADGSTKTLKTTVTVKNDSLGVDHVTAGNTGVQTIGLTGSNAWNVMDLQVYDNYGVNFEKMDGLKYNYLFGVVFSVDHIKPIDSTKPSGMIQIDQFGNITISKADGSTAASVSDANISGFDLTGASANGKSATTPVKVQ